MAYVKQKDKWMNEVIDFMLKNGVDTEIIIGDKKTKCKLWNKFPICVKDLCVDNIVLVDESEMKVYAGNFSDDNKQSVTKEKFDTKWRCLNDIDKRYVEYVKYVIINGGHTQGMNKYLEDHPKKAIKKAEQKRK